MIILLLVIIAAAGYVADAQGAVLGCAISAGCTDGRSGWAGNIDGVDPHCDSEPR